MDNFEGQDLEMQNTVVSQREPDTAPAAEPVTPAPEYQPEPWQISYEATAPRQKKPRKKIGKTIAKAVFATLLVLSLMATACGAGALVVNEYWKSRNDITNTRLLQMEQKLKDLQEFVEDNSFTGNGNSVSGTPNQGANDGLTPAQVYAQCKKGVVAINNQQTTNIWGQVSETASSGSGFIISENGYIVTNYHVAEGATKLTVILYDGTEYDAKLVGYEASFDLAVLKVEATGLPFVKMGSSNDLIVGDQVVAIGNPLGELTNSLTVGYVSAKDRLVSTESGNINMLQTDAAINSGNSGGPLFNMKGEVIGITSAKYTGTTSSGAVIEGIGFAIPMDDVAKKISDLMQYGYITGAYLGVSVQDTPAELTNYYGIPAGAYIVEVVDGYCAKAAGIKAQDIIIGLGGYEIDSLNALTRALDKFNPGEKTTVTIWRAGATLELDITFSAKPAQNSKG